jgi:hypothetical protein
MGQAPKLGTMQRDSGAANSGVRAAATAAATSSKSDQHRRERGEKRHDEQDGERVAVSGVFHGSLH